MLRTPRLVPTLLLLVPMIGCAAEPAKPFEQAADETGFPEPFGKVPSAKGDGSGARGPAIANGAATEVWAVHNGWQDTDPAAGIAWEASSGLTWEQKYDRWVESFERVGASTAGYDTFQIPTPFGDKRLEAPQLDCAEVALALRATFASWHALPFFVQGWDAHTSQTIFAGHFGFVNRAGNPVGRFPSFRTAYRDYTGEWEPGDPWPEDSRLRGYRLGDDDEVPFIEEGAGAGAYFDELVLNKRAGYFMRLLLLYFGSINLADPANMFDIEPAATIPGDVLLIRRSRTSGHTIPVLRRSEPIPDHLALSAATGSIPRRQPKWEEPQSARRHFVNYKAGGEGTNSSGKSYLELGGGIKRWYTPKLQDGRWVNDIPDADVDDYIPRNEGERLRSRPSEFEALLDEGSPDERLEVLLGRIESAREHLRNYPASCSARENRENAFEELYALASEHMDMTPAQVDAEYRNLEDYVFAELDYGRSRSCCWNSSTSAMYEIIMDYAEAEQADAESGGMCVQPTVFRAYADEGDGFARFRAHAEAIGRGGEWVAWSADESCTGRESGRTDPLAERAPTGWCELASVEETDGPGGDDGEEPAMACDADGANEGLETATPFDGAEPLSRRICTGDEDWYRVDAEGTVTVRLAFAHAEGDLDLEVLDLSDTVIDSSNSTDDGEEITAAGPLLVRVYGFSGAANDYTLTVE